VIFWKRKSVRLPGYDYSQDNAYFVTICTQGRNNYFGSIVKETSHLNDAGAMIGKWWREMERKFPTVKLDYHVVMPNHFHGIIFLSNETVQSSTPQSQSSAVKGAHIGAPLQETVQWFKTMSTNEYIHGVKEHGWRRFQEKLWQRSFYEHAIRDEASLNRIREYIITNPQRWALDRENPKAQGKDDFDLWIASFKTKPSITCGGGPTCATTSDRQYLGAAGEDLAAATLKKQGYKILERNYTCPLGEIDLVARQGKTLVVIEVKTRSNTRFGQPQEAVHPGKQAKLRLLAEYYLKQKRLEGASVRFDVVGITLADAGPQVEIIQDAF
jgi:putative transposase